MGKRFTEISDTLKGFIERQKIFFVGTAACDGRINVSPKGMDTLRVLDKNHVVWLNLTGSGNETATHLLENDRITLMFCAFEGNPMILRLYGHARLIHDGDKEWHSLISIFPPMVGARQIIDIDVDLVQTSCGMGVPNYVFQGEREGLTQWAEKIGRDGIKEYWKKNNQVSLDGKPTGI
jgi:hypothetical protein